MNHKELTAHIRQRIAHAGIKARCKMQDSCGQKVISVDVPSFDAVFSESEQRTIRVIAIANRLTFAQGMAIDEFRMTNPKEFKFYLPAQQ